MISEVILSVRALHFAECLISEVRDLYGLLQNEQAEDIVIS